MYALVGAKDNDDDDDCKNNYHYGLPAVCPLYPTTCGLFQSRVSQISHRMMAKWGSIPCTQFSLGKFGTTFTHDLKKKVVCSKVLKVLLPMKGQVDTALCVNGLSPPLKCILQWGVTVSEIQGPSSDWATGAGFSLGCTSFLSFFVAFLSFCWLPFFFQSLSLCVCWKPSSCHHLDGLVV